MSRRFEGTYTNAVDVDEYKSVCRTLWSRLSEETRELSTDSPSSTGTPASITGTSPSPSPAWKEIEIDKDLDMKSISKEEGKDDEEPTKVISRKDRIHAGLWLIALAMIFVTLTTLLVNKMESDKQLSKERHASRVDEDAAEAGKTQSEIDVASVNTTKIQEVEIGFYLDRITEHSIMESGWTADFYLWFRWTNEYSGEEEMEFESNDTVPTSNRSSSSRRLGLAKPKPSSSFAAGGFSSASDAATFDEILDPGETFQIIDGELLAKEELEREVNPITMVGDDDNLYLGDNATQQYLHYTLYRVQARLTKFFSLERFPRDNHLMTLRIEDTARDHNKLLFVADTEGSKISSRVKINGYGIDKLSVVSKLHAYKSARGDPWADPTVQINFSQFIGGIPIYRPNWGLYLMMFQGVFAAVGVAFIGLCIRNESRYDLGIGGFFAVVAATYVSSTQLPMAGVFSLADYINGVSLFTVLLTLLHIFMECHIFKGSKERWFSVLGLFIFVVGYMSCICGMSKAASI